ncbi:GCN5 family acetyltransferase [Photobacterium leiognathi subsp. mandapamensis]|nr:GCN5 family acetyltransferase [Photobacterium leiognathi subsp. mandapamensis]
MDIKIGDLTHPQVIQLLMEHQEDMYATSPADSVHALDVDGLKTDDVTFYTCWERETLLGCVAIKRLDADHAELKSMRTKIDARNRGVGARLLEYVLVEAHSLGFKTISLETGSHNFFESACRLYEKFGFEYCEPFADYLPDPHSLFMRYDFKQWQ